MTSLKKFREGVFFLCLLFFIDFSESTPWRRRKIERHEVPATEIDEDGCRCVWTPWMNNDDYSRRKGDNNTFANLRRLHDFCQTPRDIKCREKYNFAIPFYALKTGGSICDVTTGLMCVSRPHRQKPFYCDDYEVTVQCCTCPTTTTEATTSTTEPSPKQETTLVAASNLFLKNTVESPQLNNNSRPISNQTYDEKSTSSDDEVPLFVILISVFGFIVIVAFVVIIYLLLFRSTGHRKRKIPHQDFYKESPAPTYNQIERQKQQQPRPKVAFSRSLNRDSSSDYVTSSSEDEGYRSRTRYSRKRKTKAERDRKLNGNRGNGEDSLGTFPSLELQPISTTDSSDEGRFRRWFPDEYERSLQQKRAQAGKTKLLFSVPFNANNRKSIPYADDNET